MEEPLPLCLPCQRPALSLRPVTGAQASPDFPPTLEVGPKAFRDGHSSINRTPIIARERKFLYESRSQTTPQERSQNVAMAELSGSAGKNRRCLCGNEESISSCMGWMTGFELHRTLHHINKINRIARQITEKPGKKSANLQPVATKLLPPMMHFSLMRKRHEHPSHSSLSSLPYRPPNVL